MQDWDGSCGSAAGQVMRLWGTMPIGWNSGSVMQTIGSTWSVPELQFQARGSRSPTYRDPTLIDAIRNVRTQRARVEGPEQTDSEQFAQLAAIHQDWWYARVATSPEDVGARVEFVGDLEEGNFHVTAMSSLLARNSEVVPTVALAEMQHDRGQARSSRSYGSHGEWLAPCSRGGGERRQELQSTRSRWEIALRGSWTWGLSLKASQALVVTSWMWLGGTEVRQVIKSAHSGAVRQHGGEPMVQWVHCHDRGGGSERREARPSDYAGSEIWTISVTSSRSWRADSGGLFAGSCFSANSFGSQAAVIARSISRMATVRWSVFRSLLFDFKRHVDLGRDCGKSLLVNAP